MVHVFATITTAEGQREAFLNEFRALVPTVLAEQGCIDYGPAVDADSGIENQDHLGPNVVAVVEQWESVDALQAHLAAPHMNEFRSRVADLVTGIQLNVLKPA